MFNCRLPTTSPYAFPSGMSARRPIGMDKHYILIFDIRSCVNNTLTSVIFSVSAKAIIAIIRRQAMLIMFV
jgi:hypothetical protein